MKFVRFIYNNKESIGVFSKDESSVIDIASILKVKSFKSMIDLIENISKEEILNLKNEILKENKEYKSYKLGDIKICSPIERPIHDILCVGVNYEKHLEEAKRSFDKGNFKEPSKTVYFSKRASKIIGSGEAIISRLDLDEKLDYEVELAVIIGKKGTDIPKDKAEEHIFGYSVFNDISSRGLQQEHCQWYRGKSLDTYTVMGPCILYKDELPFPIEVDISSSVNGEIRQSSNTKMFLRDIPSIIEEISKGITLEPGDIIATGTPSGVGMGFNPPKFMKKGDTVICEISKIGKLINNVK
jgi:2-keto-4-pentenoate hydratase/2-oxohepta-3-ene-1,7-dioic acid hydratase in catechol pathway